MNNVLNEFRLLGRLTSDPEYKTMQGKNGEIKIANYSLAINKKYGEGTDFFPIECFGPTAQWVSNNLYKGVKIFVEGSLSRNSYTTKDGRSVHETVLVASNHIFAEAKRKTCSEGTASSSVSIGSEGFINISDPSEYDGILPLSDDDPDSPWK